MKYDIKLIEQNISRPRILSELLDINYEQRNKRYSIIETILTGFLVGMFIYDLINF